MTTLLMTLAGGLGASVRFGLDSWLRRTTIWSIHLINVSGSFLLGLLVGLHTGSTWLTVLGIGFLGGYTTFSTASLDAAQLVFDRKYTKAAVNVISMVLLSVAAASCGYALA